MRHVISPQHSTAMFVETKTNNSRSTPVSTSVDKSATRVSVIATAVVAMIAVQRVCRGNNPRPWAASRPSNTDVAKHQAGEVAKTASDAGKHLAGVAGEQAGQVASEATHQVKQLVQQTRGELTEQAATQQKRVASGLRSLSTELSTMAQGSEQPGMATDLAQQAGERANAVASWLEEREPGHVVEEITRFARQRPGAFLALAAGAGFLVGRLGRGLKRTATTAATTPRPRMLVPPRTPGWSTPPPRVMPPSRHPRSRRTPPTPGYDPSGYQPAPGYQGRQPPAPSPAPSPGYPQGASGRDLAP